MKIPIENQEENEENNQFAKKEIIAEEKDKTLEKLYQNKELQIIQKPPKISPKTVVISIIISLILGILIGFLGAILFLKEKLPIFLKF